MLFNLEADKQLFLFHVLFGVGICAWRSQIIWPINSLCVTEHLSGHAS